MTATLIGLVGIVAAAWGAWYARRALWPQKRELTISALSPAPLLSPVSSDVQGLSVIRDGQPLANPYVVTLSIENTGRFDVSRAAFDAQIPISIEMNVPILDILERGSSTATVSGMSLEIGPDLIKIDKRISVQLLTEGKPALDNLSERVTHQLIDVDVLTHGTTEMSVDQGRRFGRRGRGLVPIIALLSIIVILCVEWRIQFTRLDDKNKVLKTRYEQLANGERYRPNLLSGIYLSPSHGPSGTSVTIRGEVFDPNTFYKISISDGSTGKTSTSSVKTDSEGHLSAKFTVPQAVNGDVISVLATPADENNVGLGARFYVDS